MWKLVHRAILRSGLRTALIVGALAVPVAFMVCLSSYTSLYERSLRSELDRTGAQMMLVPIGCPYDAAARVVKGQPLDATLPQSALDTARSDPAVAAAAPMLLLAIPRAGENRADLWAGVDEASRTLKPWWKAQAGADWFASPDGVILGAEAAAIEMRSPGDKFYSPEAKRTLHVDGVLAPSGTSDDHLFFVQLSTAQAMFGQTNRLTAVAIRLREPELLREAARRLQEIPGAQVATLTEMMGVFLNMVGSARILAQSVALLAVTVCGLGVFNTMLASVLERADELGLMRAVGASRIQVFVLVTMESALLSAAAAVAGLALAFAAGGGLAGLIRPLLPLAPQGAWWHVTGSSVAGSFAICLGVGIAAGIYPAWRASRVHPATALKCG